MPPPPRRVAATPYEVFHCFGVERRRAETMRRLAVVAHRLEETAALALDLAYQRFQAIIGIGPWTAARVAMLALGDGDAVFVGDLHLPHMVSSALAGKRRGSDERMLELLEPYRGHRARVVRLLLAEGTIAAVSEWDAPAYNRLNNPMQTWGEAMVASLHSAATRQPWTWAAAAAA